MTLRRLALIWGIAMLVAGSTSALGGDPPSEPSPAQVAQAYERFRHLVGEWRARSTKGWTSRTEYRVLGRATVVLGLSSFDDAPPERDMASAIHPDGGRLILTHYCEAGNQPRLVASRISPDADEVEFRFLDGTNMKSRNEGHMDRAVFRFLDENHFSSKWTWFQDGNESWMEEILFTRVTEPMESSR